MRVHDLLAAHRAELMQAWRDHARQSAPGTDGPDLLDDLPALLDELTGVMRTQEPAAESRIRAAARRHAELRFAQGAPLTRVIDDYRLLRRTALGAVVQDTATHQRVDAPDLQELAALDLALDEAVAAAVARFVDLRQRRLEVLQERLRLALDSAAIGTWELDVRTGVFTWDERCGAIFGVSGAQHVSYAQFLALVHPDDRQRVDERARGALKRRERAAYAGEYRIVRAGDGEVRWLAVRGSAVFEGGSHAVRFVGTVIDITDAKVAEEVRERFLSVLGHDLRAPLASISMSAQHLARSGNVLPPARGALTRIARASDRMTRMTRDLLDLARGRLGGFAVSLANADVGAICKSVVEETRAAHPGRAIAILVADDVRGMCDRDRIAQAVTNLVANALTHGVDPIVVEASATADELMVTVSNAGPPIPEDERRSLFDPFRRGRSAQGRGHGLGLGLYIVSEIAKSHGGAVAFSSDERRTAFRLSWPRDARRR